MYDAGCGKEINIFQKAFIGIQIYIQFDIIFGAIQVLE